MPKPDTTRRTTPRSASALNASGAAPEWIEVLPAGPDIVGADGRSWQLRDAARVVADSQKSGALHVDYEHASELVAKKGGEAPAAGWINALEVRDGAIWARVEWTPRAAAMVANREYRFVSPVFLYDTSTREVLSLVSVALTNRPNLEMTALNREGADDHVQPKEAPHMNAEQMTALCKKLGLKDEASGDAILAAVDGVIADKATALNAAQTPDITKFVPRAQYDKAASDLAIATNTIKQIETDRLEAEYVAVVDGAVTAGKVPPATRDTYLAMCRKGGLEDVKALIAAAPVLTGASGLDAKLPGKTGDGALSDAERALCTNMGLTEDAFRKAKAA